MRQVKFQGWMKVSPCRQKCEIDWISFQMKYYWKRNGLIWRGAVSCIFSWRSGMKRDLMIGEEEKIKIIWNVKALNIIIQMMECYAGEQRAGDRYAVGSLKSENVSPLGSTGFSASSRPKNWTFDENELYILFLQENKKSFEDQQTRRFSKIFLEMSMNINSKTPQQCRTHHQKALKKYQRIDRIISHLLPDMKLKMEKQKSQEQKILEDRKKYKILSRGFNNLTIVLSESFFEDD